MFSLSVLTGDACSTKWNYVTFGTLILCNIQQVLVVWYIKECVKVEISSQEKYWQFDAKLRKTWEKISV